MGLKCHGGDESAASIYEKRTKVPIGKNDANPSRRPVVIEDILVDSVTETLTEVLGANVAVSFWRYYDSYLSHRRTETTNRLDPLFPVLGWIFGVGGDILGRRIIQKLYAKANVPLTLRAHNPPAYYLEELKRILAENS